MEPIRILIVDDHAILREGTRQLLDDYADLLVVGESASGEDALIQVEREHPDVVILDIQLPGMNGIAVTRRIAPTYPETRVLVLSAHDEEDYVHAAIGAGARGYLLKTSRAEEIARAVRIVHAGAGTILDPSLHLGFGTPRSGPGNHPGTLLTTRERQIVALVGEGLSNKAIAERLHISPRTVEGHLHRIFDKEDVGSRVELVRHALDHSVLFTP